MNIPRYDETICPICKNSHTCSKDKYKEKIQHTKDFTGDMKVTKCKYYEMRG